MSVTKIGRYRAYYARQQAKVLTTESNKKLLHTLRDRSRKAQGEKVNFGFRGSDPQNGGIAAKFYTCFVEVVKRHRTAKKSSPYLQTVPRYSTLNKNLKKVRTPIARKACSRKFPKFARRRGLPPSIKFEDYVEFWAHGGAQWIKIRISGLGGLTHQMAACPPNFTNAL